MVPVESTTSDEVVDIDDLRDAWPVLSREEKLDAFRLLGQHDREDFYLTLLPREQAELVLALPATERRTWMRLLSPHDAADIIQQVSPEDAASLMPLIDDVTRSPVAGLLAYTEDEAGGLMNPNYVQVMRRISSRTGRTLEPSPARSIHFCNVFQST